MLLSLILAFGPVSSTVPWAIGSANAADPGGTRAGAPPATGTASAQTMKAVADLEAKSGSKISGTVTFTQVMPSAPMPGAPGGGGMGGGAAGGGMGGGGMGGGAAGGGVEHQRPATEPPVKVSVHLTNASPGNHAVFLHESGDCSAPDASSAGSYFNPAAEGMGGGMGGESPASPEAPSGGEAGTPGSGGRSGGSTSTGTLPGGVAAGQPTGFLGFVNVGPDGKGEKDFTTTSYSLGEGPNSIVNRAVVVYEKAPDFSRSNWDPGARQACGVIKVQTAPGSAGRTTGPTETRPTH